MKIENLCQPIQLILSDVDGVMTDGRLVFDNQGIESKAFHIRDGLGVKLWQRAGFRFGIVTGRTSQIVKLRAGELGIELVRQGFDEKLPVVRQILSELQLSPQQLAYIGDDLNDLPVIGAAGLGIAVADAAAEVRQAADLVTKVPGGGGAVREAIETILNSMGRWDDLLKKYQ